jgi:glycosyltransferase involved in cell wall biosynthesis
VTGRAVRPLRVAHLDHTASAGGAEYALARMFRSGPEWSAVLLLPPTADEDVFTGAVGTVPVRRYGVAQRAGVSSGGTRTLAALGASLLAQAAATRLRGEFRSADVIDANTSRAAAYGALAARTSRVPFVVHLRDIIDTTALGGAGHALMTRLVLPRADGVIANSAYTLAAAMPYLRSDAVTRVIPSASGLHRSPAHRHPASALRIGMLARIDPWKGQDLLIEAFAAAFADGDATLELAGGAPFGHDDYVDELRTHAVRLGVGERVSLPGHVSDVDALLATWDVGVQASRRPEPLGQNVLQYLAAGVPAVVADEGGPREWVHDGVNGLRVQPRDEAALAAALRRLSDDLPLLARLGEGARNTPGLLTDIEVTRAHADVYAEVVRRVGARR